MHHSLCLTPHHVYSSQWPLQVRALARLGHEVLVIAGTPAAHSKARDASGARCLLEVELPRWGLLNRGCAWQEFARGMAGFAEQVAAFGAHAGMS